MDNRVVILRQRDYEQAAVDAAVEHIFASLPAAGRLSASSRVLLKPNLLAKHGPEKAVTTNPAVVGAVIRAVKHRGVSAGQIVCADSMGGLYNASNMKAVYAVSGLEAICTAEGVSCYTDCKWGPRAVKNGKRVQEFNLIQPVLEADFIIDLAKLKTHVMTGYTGAVKNLFGCIPGLQKAELHTRFPQKVDFGNMLIDLLETVHPDMAIIDGITALEGDGPAGGDPRQVGLLLAGENLLNLDLAACDIIGLDPMRVPYLSAAFQRGLCGESFSAESLEGDSSAFAPIPDFVLPSSYRNGNGSTDFADRFGVFTPFVKWVEKNLAAPRPKVNGSICIGCGKCAEICPRHTISFVPGKKNRRAVIVPDHCIRCFCCHEMCPVKAIDVKRMNLFQH